MPEAENREAITKAAAAGALATLQDEGGEAEEEKG